MTPREAIDLAKTYVKEVFGPEGAINIGLEEMEKEGGQWAVTVGFSRPWDAPLSPYAAALAPVKLRRDYKIVRIKDADKEVVSVKNRDV